VLARPSLSAPICFPAELALDIEYLATGVAPFEAPAEQVAPARDSLRRANRPQLCPLSERGHTHADTHLHTRRAATCRAARVGAPQVTGGGPRASRRPRGAPPLECRRPIERHSSGRAHDSPPAPLGPPKCRRANEQVPSALNLVRPLACPRLALWAASVWGANFGLARTLALSFVVPFGLLCVGASLARARQELATSPSSPWAPASGPNWSRGRAGKLHAPWGARGNHRIVLPVRLFAKQIHRRTFPQNLPAGGASTHTVCSGRQARPVDGKPAVGQARGPARSRGRDKVHHACRTLFCTHSGSLEAAQGPIGLGRGIGAKRAKCSNSATSH